ncbi:MAG: hypothetical protein ACPKPY_11115 [Nitrososphaeraceae archaeon]
MISENERVLLQRLILYSELFNLTIDETLNYIKEKLGKSIAKRTYYYYKNKFHIKKYKNIIELYSAHGELLIDYYNDVDDIKYYPDLMLLKRYFVDYYAELNKASINSFYSLLDFGFALQASEKKYENIPLGATVREEFIHCCKSYCNLKHGPYYYAYWRDKKSKKLKKKYLGKFDPRANASKEILHLTNQIFPVILSTLRIYLKNDSIETY